jgi:hypothetical protein
MRCLAMDICEPRRKYLLQQRFSCCGRLEMVAYLLRACLPSRSLAMDLHVTIYFNIHENNFLEMTHTFVFAHEIVGNTF